MNKRCRPAVFDIKRKRWIRPELATAEEVAAQVRRCPLALALAVEYSEVDATPNQEHYRPCPCRTHTNR
jgi:hypothetical protein